MRNQVQGNPFHDCYELEQAMCHLFGFRSRWYHSVGWYSRPTSVRKAMLAATQRIRTRLDDILTIDVRLLAVTSSILDRLEDESSNIGEYHNQLEIIAHLMTLIAHLLGYARMTGKPMREVIYYQTAEQIEADERLARDEDPRADRSLVLAKRREVAQMLQGQGMRTTQIARILKESEHHVRAFLQEDRQVK